MFETNKKPGDTFGLPAQPHTIGVFNSHYYSTVIIRDVQDLFSTGTST